MEAAPYKVRILFFFLQVGMFPTNLGISATAGANQIILYLFGVCNTSA